MDKKLCGSFCNGVGSLRAPISLQIGLRMDEQNGDECFLAIGGRDETGCPFRRRSECLVFYGS